MAGTVTSLAGLWHDAVFPLPPLKAGSALQTAGYRREAHPADFRMRVAIPPPPVRRRRFRALTARALGRDQRCVRQSLAAIPTG